MRSVKPWAAVLAASSIALAACGGGGDESSDSGDSGSSTPGAVAVTGTDTLKFEPTALSATAGEVTFELTSGAAVQHNVVVEGVNGDAVVVEAAAGETATGTVTLTAGDYTFYCNVAGHREAGMEGTLTVS